MGYLATLREITAHPANRSNPMRSVLRYVGWNVARRLIEVEFVSSLCPGVRIVYSNQENYSTLVYNNGLFDFEAMMLARHLLRSDDLALDIGANIGVYTALIAAGAKGQVIAVEPIPETFRNLARNVRFNDADDRVELHNCGVGESDGVLRFTDHKGGMNHVAPNGQGVEVPIRRIDDIVAGRAPVLMKIDIEGFELFALKGAPKTLKSLQAIIIEMNESGGRYGVRDADVDAFLVSAGFTSCRYDPANRAIAPATGRNGINALYIRDIAATAARAATGPAIRVGGRDW